MRHLTERPDRATTRARRLRADAPHGPDPLAASLVRDLAPRGPLQELLAGRIARAATRLADAIEPRAERLAERSLLRLLAAFHRLRSARGWGHADDAPPSVIREEDFPFDEPTESPPVAPADDLDAALDASRLWRDRLTLDPNVSATSPVVRGTWVTVGHVVTLVVDGWSWSDILRDHPELSEADIRACLTYAVEEENMGPVS